MRKILLALLSLALSSSVGAQSCCDSDTKYIRKVDACSQPIGLAPSGTMGANGAVTLGTALAITYSGGIWLHFPSGAVSSGSAAGFYWTVMSTTTAGTVYTNTVDPTSASPCLSKPSSPTAVSDAGPGAYTASTSETVVYSITIPGGMLGKNGWIQSVAIFAHNNSAGTKTGRIRLGGLGGDLNQSIAATTTRSDQSITFIRNRNSYSSQVMYTQGSTNFGTVNADVVVGTIDTSASTTEVFTCTHGTATDACILETQATTVYYAP